MCTIYFKSMLFICKKVLLDSFLDYFMLIYVLFCLFNKNSVTKTYL